MRKLTFTIKSLIFLTLCFQIQISTAQDFGRKPFRECWRLEHENMSNLEIASDNAGGLYLPLSDGSVEAIDETLGKPFWRTEIGGEIVSPLTLDEKKLYLASKSSSDDTEKNSQEDASENVTVRALSLLTGVTIWRQTISGGEKVFQICGHEKLYLLTDSGTFYALDKESGRVLFKRELGVKVDTPPSLNGSSLYFGSARKKIVEISIEDGRVLNEIDIDDTPTTVAGLSSSVIFLGDSLGNIRALQTQNKRILWTTRVGAGIIDITKIPRGLLVSSFDNYIYLLSEKNGEKIWKKRLAGRSAGKPLIRDEVAVFAILGAANAAFIELRKGKQINQIPIQDENYFINNPVRTNRLTVFQTFKGLYAFGEETVCQNQEIKKEM
jgi:outer membrane protein assembly factor BamB